MTIQQMEYIVALDTYRHFVTAAEKCFVTQPTLTMQLKKLEEEIGMAIFDRKQSPLTPTKMGETIILKARAILREVHQLKELVNDEKEGLSGEFTIGVIPTIAPYLIPLFAMNFAHRYPEAKLRFEELKSEDIITALNTDKIDMGLMVTPLSEPNLREVSLYREPFKIYASKQHPLSGKKQVKADIVAKMDGLWVLNQGHCFRNQVLNLCQQKKSHSFDFESGSIETIKSLIKHNEGFTLVPELAINQSESSVSFSEPIPSREVSLVVHNGFAKEKLIEALREQILAVIPDSFVKNEHYIRVKWR